SQLYHLVQSRIKTNDDTQTRATLTGLEQALATGLPEPARSAIAAQVEALRAELAAPAVGAVTWAEAVDVLASTRALNHWIRPAWRSHGRDFAPRDIAELLLLREVARRPMRQNSVETLGLVSVSYESLAKIGEG